MSKNVCQVKEVKHTNKNQINLQMDIQCNTLQDLYLIRYL